MIGIFDSGVGGMTVARAVEQLLPAILFSILAILPEPLTALKVRKR